MYPVIVVTEVRHLPPDERWKKLVAPLQQRPIASGRGRVLDFELIQRETCDVDEIAVQLAHLSYGRELVDRVIKDARLTPCDPVLPRCWRRFRNANKPNARILK